MTRFLTSSSGCMLVVILYYVPEVFSSTYVVEPGLQDLQIDICAQRRSFVISSFQDCAYACLVQDYCVSFFFNSLTLFCQLHITVFSPADGNLSTASSESKYYYLKTWTATTGEISFNATTGTCLHLHTENRTWDEASVICSKEGGHLLAIDTDAKHDYLAEFLKNYKGYYPLFIGAKRNINDEWAWEGGALVQSFHWCQQMPPDKECMTFKAGQCWGARRCEGAHGFICET